VIGNCGLRQRKAGRRLRILPCGCGWRCGGECLGAGGDASNRPGWVSPVWAFLEKLLFWAYFWIPRFRSSTLWASGEISSSSKEACCRETPEAVNPLMVLLLLVGFIERLGLSSPSPCPDPSRTSPPLQLRDGEREATQFQRRFPPFSLQSGGRFGTGEDGERGFRWLLYIVLPSLGSLGSDGVLLVEVMTPLGNKLRRPLLHLAGEYSGASEGLLRHKLAGSRGIRSWGVALLRLARPLGTFGGQGV